MDLLFFIQGIPETVSVIALSLALARIPLRWGPIIPAGAVISITGSIIRALPVALGLHTIATLLLCVLFINKATRVSPAKGFITLTASVGILLFLETVIHLFIFNFIGLDLTKIPQDSLLWAVIGLPQAIIVFISALIVSKLKKPTPGGWRI
jgi:hypothetical protein